MIFVYKLLINEHMEHFFLIFLIDILTLGYPINVHNPSDKEKCIYHWFNFLIRAIKKKEISQVITLT